MTVRQTSTYIDPTEYDDYGLPASTKVAQVRQASQLLDAYLKRPEGLCYGTNDDGTPVCMASKTAAASFKVLNAITPGSSVVLNVAGSLARPELVQQSFMLDTLNGDVVEACVVQQVISPSQILVQSVRYAHAAGANAMFGVAVTEVRSLPKGRSIARISKTPAINVLACAGRYTYERRSDEFGGLNQDIGLLAELSILGGVGTPIWVSIDPYSVNVTSETGEVFVPGSLYMAYYDEVRIQYLAGWPVGGVPDAIKQGVAALITNKALTADLGGTLTSIKAGDTQISRSASQGLSSLDADTRRMIEGYRAIAMY